MGVPPLRHRADRLLAALYGAEAAFRDGQWEAIEELIDEGRRVLVVQRTGWGKSLVYFVATRLLRERGSGPAILISPLLSLMRNQVEKTMENSAHQAANVRNAFEVVPERVREGPVLLVDDMADSRWTLTECTRVLRTAGSGLVFPLVLANSSGTDDEN